MKLIRSSRSGRSSVNAKDRPKKTFDGDVWVDPVLSDDGISIHNVMFTPGARSFWHWHEQGQILRVTVGSGWVCDRGGEPQRINVGDIVYCPADTVHWHGADEKSYMVHQATTLGKVKFLEQVSDEEYASCTKAS
ncbi:RmlC-like cupin domain-containing protein [Ilyonectria sp. MPI-CAGE-AT-0026]|nr:RmlC-like cupin domain-containing protein [Ilyonectria sp. MPI-CAGE-AT-0026]